MVGKLRAPRLSSSHTEFEPVIMIDTREQEPLLFSRLQSIRGTLPTGDYSVVGLEELFSVERKSLPDLVACCMGENRSRFERELHRLRGFKFKRLLIVGTEEDILAGRYHSAIKPNAVMATLGAFEVRYDLPVVFRPTAKAAAQQVERWAWWFSREIVKAAANLQKSEVEVNAK